jgi:hypothetical protein
VPSPSAIQWPPGYGNDKTINVYSQAPADGGAWANLPTVEVRGGSATDIGNGSGDGAGIFSLFLYVSPAFPTGNIGFRCVIPG